MNEGTPGFTPGPWVAIEVEPETGAWSVRGPFVVDCGDFNAPDEANARLIAAAPELFEAAKLTVLHFQRSHASREFQGDDEHEAWSALTRALAKALPSPGEHGR